MADIPADDLRSLAELMNLAKVLDHPAIVRWNKLVSRPFVDPRFKRTHRGKRGGRARA